MRHSSVSLNLSSARWVLPPDSGCWTSTVPGVQVAHHSPTELRLPTQGSSHLEVLPFPAALPLKKKAQVALILLFT